MSSLSLRDRSAQRFARLVEASPESRIGHSQRTRGVDSSRLLEIAEHEGYA